jgi:hypothetical protein
MSAGGRSISVVPAGVWVSRLCAIQPPSPRRADLSYWVGRPRSDKAAFEAAAHPSTASDFTALHGHKYALLVRASWIPPSGRFSLLRRWDEDCGPVDVLWPIGVACSPVVAAMEHQGHHPGG